VLESESVKLGKNFELKYIPFSELAIPWNVRVDSNQHRSHGAGGKQPRVSTYGAGPRRSKASKTLKREELDALKHSIAQFGLLRPFEVAELPERVDFFYGGKGRYAVIDGQKRYFALRELLRLPSEDEEKEQKEGLRTNSGHDPIERAELQAQEQFDQLSIRNHVLIPCLLYPYTTFLQMMRHSVEEKRFTARLSSDDLKVVEKMRQEGLQDIVAEDLGKLWVTRSRLDEERASIEKTLQEIRNRSQQSLLQYRV
jgi:ParB-like chromosome segregation protein Spo0J